MSDAAPHSAKASKIATPQTSVQSSTSAARKARYADSFANIVSVLMRDPGFRDLRLADLEWLVLPPIMSGQWKLAQTRADEPAPDTAKADKPGTSKVAGTNTGAVVVPTAVALWASVSPEIDKRLSENLDQPIQLKSHEWLSGDILWLIVAAGDKRIVPSFLKQLAATDFKGKTVKARTNGPGGKVVVRTLKS